MKLIIYSIVCGLIAALVILNISGKGDEFGIISFIVVGFFSPGLYVLDKLYAKSKEKNIEE